MTSMSRSAAWLLLLDEHHDAELARGLALRHLLRDVDGDHARTGDEVVLDPLLDRADRRPGLVL